MIFKLLVVDDEAIMRKGIANFIDWDSLDCKVAGTAGNGIEAIEFIKTNPVDIVITDIKMPGADGLAVAKFIYENKSEIKVILLTGYADFEYAQTAIKYNVSAFILKPTNKKELLEAIQDAQKQIATSRKHSSIAKGCKEELAFLKDQLLLEMTGSAYLPSFQERLSTLGISLEHYYIAAFQLVPLENDIAFLKNIIINEKKNSLDLFHFENHLHNWLFEDANAVLHKIFNKFKINFVNSADAKNICAQIYYICCRVLIKRENEAPSGEYLSRISKATDIFSLENTVYALMDYTKEHSVGNAAVQNKLFDHAVKFIHSHLSEPLSLDILSEHLHISPSHLSRTFKKVCGESLTEYINHVRIEKAKEYLFQKDILAYEVANLVGYNDATYFSSIFKKYTGVSPTEYRQKNVKPSLI